MKLIAQQWDLYVLGLPADVPAAQLQEARRVFYAGAQAAAEAIGLKAEWPTLTHYRRMDSILAELKAHAETAQGRA